jgi:hypothetical protein
MRSRTFLALLAALTALVPARDAAACDVAAPSPLVVDAAEKAVDHTPPSAPTGVTTSVRRGRGPQKQGCGATSATSCDDVGTITLAPTATDDRTPAAKLGYRVRLVAGALPAGASLPAGAVVPFQGLLPITWIDGAEDDQEVIDFTVTLTAVDLAGNEGPASAPVHVTDPGGSAGCRVRGAGDAASAALLAGLILAARAIRRGRRRR